MSKHSTESEAAEHLSELVRQERRRLGLGLREAARTCGVGFSTLSRVERGIPPSFEGFVRIARWLKLDGFK